MKQLGTYSDHAHCGMAKMRRMLRRYSDGDWPTTAQAQNLLLLQALHHGNDHRTHVCTILGAHGLPLADVSGWEYWSALYHQR